MPRVTVRAGARIHVGFRNLSLDRERLYGGIGIGLEEPFLAVTAEPAETVTASDDTVARYAATCCDRLDLPGATVSIERRFPRHVGLGSGTQLALATLTAIAEAHDRQVSVRDHAPALGRGGRSGVGVATFEAGEFVMDRGHPTGAFTTAPPEPGSWSVPPVESRRALPRDWRVLLVIPDARRGRAGTSEDASMRAVVDQASPAVATEIDRLVAEDLLPGIEAGDVTVTGRALTAIGQANGQWYQGVQGGRYRSPADELIDTLASADAVYGYGQSSWGPTVYGLTTATDVTAAERAGRQALEESGHDGTVLVVTPVRSGASIDPV